MLHDSQLHISAALDPSINRCPAAKTSSVVRPLPKIDDIPTMSTLGLSQTHNVHMRTPPNSPNPPLDVLHTARSASRNIEPSKHMPPLT